MIYKIIIFLVLNFGALAIGSIWTSGWATGEWYMSMNQAPWTPPGWFFGLAWFTIMFCFSFYMAFAWEKIKNHKKLASLFGIQWILNIAWNPIFFSENKVWFALITISSLTLLMIYILNTYCKDMKKLSLLVLPYVLWLITATSLNAYILLNN